MKSAPSKIGDLMNRSREKRADDMGAHPKISTLKCDGRCSSTDTVNTVSALPQVLGRRLGYGEVEPAYFCLQEEEGSLQPLFCPLSRTCRMSAIYSYTFLGVSRVCIRDRRVWSAFGRLVVLVLVRSAPSVAAQRSLVRAKFACVCFLRHASHVAFFAVFLGWSCRRKSARTSPPSLSSAVGACVCMIDGFRCLPASRLLSRETDACYVRRHHAQTRENRVAVAGSCTDCAKFAHTQRHPCHSGQSGGVTVRCRSVLMGEWHVLGASRRPVPPGRRAGCVGWCVFAGSHRAKQHLAYMYATGREWRFNSREPAFFFLQIELLPIGLFCRGKEGGETDLHCCTLTHLTPSSKHATCTSGVSACLVVPSTEQV